MESGIILELSSNYIHTIICFVVVENTVKFNSKKISNLCNSVEND